MYDHVLGVFFSQDVVHAFSQVNSIFVQDEIKEYIDGRYLGVCEAAWRVFRFGLHKEFPSVCRLDLHLPNEQVNISLLAVKVGYINSTLQLFFVCRLCVLQKDRIQSTS